MSASSNPSAASNAGMDVDASLGSLSINDPSVPAKAPAKKAVSKKTAASKKIVRPTTTASSSSSSSGSVHPPSAPASTVVEPVSPRDSDPSHGDHAHDQQSEDPSAGRTPGMISVDEMLARSKAVRTAKFTMTSVEAPAELFEVGDEEPEEIVDAHDVHRALTALEWTHNRKFTPQAVTGRVSRRATIPKTIARLKMQIKELEKEAIALNTPKLLGADEYATALHLAREQAIKQEKIAASIIDAAARREEGLEAACRSKNENADAGRRSKKRLRRLIDDDDAEQ